MTYPLRGDSVTIGRGPENSIQIIDSLMSRVHARLKQTGGAWAFVEPPWPMRWCPQAEKPLQPERSR